jgi:hypothetical protein
MRRLTLIVIATAVLILFWQLLVPPVVGLAPDGDFPKLLGPLALGTPVDHPFIYADTNYEFADNHHWASPFYSSETILLRLAVFLNGMVSKDGRFDLRAIGIVHSAVFLLALWLFLPLLEDLKPWARYTVAFAALFIFGDVSYVGYLNSFYMDVAAYLCLLLTVIVFLRVLRWGRRRDQWLLLIPAVLLVTSKPPHAVLGLWLALLFLIEAGVLWSKRRAILLATIVVVASAACFRYAMPQDMVAQPFFSLVFYQLLPHAQNQDRMLADLGLDASYRQYIGKFAYSEGVYINDPRFTRAFLRRVSYATLARFYLTHPRVTWRTLVSAASEAGRHRPVLGNFDSGAGMKPFEQSHAFAYWSDWKRSLFFNRGARLVGWFAALAAAVLGLLLAQRRTLPRGALAAGAVLIAMAATEFAISSLADALDFPRHHLLFFVHCDLLLLAAGWLSVRPLALMERTRRLSETRLVAVD